MMYTKDKKVVIHIRIPDDDYASLKRLSETSGLSISEIIRQFIMMNVSTQK